MLIQSLTDSIYNYQNELPVIMELTFLEKLKSDLLFSNLLQYDKPLHNGSGTKYSSYLNRKVYLSNNIAKAL